MIMMKQSTGLVASSITWCRTKEPSRGSERLQRCAATHNSIRVLLLCLICYERHERLSTCSGSYALLGSPADSKHPSHDWMVSFCRKLPVVLWDVVMILCYIECLYIEELTEQTFYASHLKKSACSLSLLLTIVGSPGVLEILEY